MKLWAAIRALVSGFLKRSRSEEEMDEELRAHVRSRADDLQRGGLPHAEAERRARIEFGAHEKFKQECREQRQAFWLETLWADIRFGARLLRRSPGFTAVAILTLALGIGANTAIFTVVQGVLLAPLPYPAPDRLVMVWENNPRFRRVWVSYPNFQDWQRAAHSFLRMAAGANRNVDLTGPGAPEHLSGKEISAGMLATLGVELSLGREFSPQEDQRGGNPVAIISDHLWRNRFGGSVEVLGTTVTLDGVDYTIIGVTPRGLRLGNADADVYTPLGQGDPVILDDRGGHDGIFAIARLGSGVTLAQAQAEMNTLQSGLDHLYPDANRDLGVYLEPLKQVIVGDVGKLLFLLLGAVGFVLLIACANVANLLLSRSAARSTEFAIRSALGANRARLLRQLLTESVLLSLVGAVVGLLLAVWIVPSMLTAFPGALPRSGDVRVSAPVLLFTLALSIAVGVLFGIAPALKGWRLGPQEALKKGGRGSLGGSHRAQGALVIVQMALTLVLLVGAGLLFRTIRSLSQVNPGFDLQRLIAFKVGVSPSLTKTPASTRTAYQQLIERIRAIPGVQAADFTDTVPLSGDGGTMPFWINSQKPASLQGAPRVSMSLVGPDYLHVMRIPLLKGRFFTANDTVVSPCVIVIDNVLSGTFFRDSDPVGQTMSAGFSPVGPCRIVGVVGHVSEWQLDESRTSPQAQAYFPLYQDPDPWVRLEYPATTLLVRTPLDAATLMPAVKDAVYAAGSDQPIYDVKTMQEIASKSMSSQRFPMILLGAFAGLALLLASVGIYGVISYTVSQRLHEIGIRMALGAGKGDVFRMVVGQGLGLALTGLAIGAAAALVLSRLLSSFSHLLYGVTGNDPLTFAVVSAAMILLAIVACYIPARRAARVDPLVALRYE